MSAAATKEQRPKCTCGRWMKWFKSNRLGTFWYCPHCDREAG